ncbi:hypothetical protein C8F01DRAFT_1250527 [Mycena amicta]|nr:hypothetical protein C8F01DRAFT_1250527 [Mycena amicta]
MPTLSLAYGSFGDILATAQLVAKIVLFLRRGGTLSRAQTETETELKALGSDLALLTLHQPSAPTITVRIQEEVVCCHRVMARFFARISSSQGLVQKIMWALSEEKELAAFRAQVIERRTALGVLIGLMNSCVILKYIGPTLIKGRGDLAAVRNRVDEVGGHGHALIRDVHEHVNGLAQQLAAYQAQIVALVAHVPHGVSEDTFTVLSQTGVPIPISLAYCTSYEVLDGILKTYMRGRTEAGGDYVERGDYNIAWPDGEEIESAQLMDTVKAGIRLEMGIIQRNHEAFLGKVQCPQCGGDGGTVIDICPGALRILW